MAYCTLSDIEHEVSTDVLIELTDGGTTIDETVIGTAIARADAIIDSYLGLVCPVPLSSAPADVVELSVDIAVYTLFSRKENVPKFRIARYDDAMKRLREISEGKAVIGNNGTVDQSDSDSWPLHETAPADFGRRTWQGY